jgi:hypothetical protein
VIPPTISEGAFQNNLHVDIPLYLDFRRVPSDLQTRYQWARGWRGGHRKIKAKERPAARYISEAEYEAFLDRQMYLGTSEPLDPQQTVSLFREDQTLPFDPSSRTQACWRFFDLFVEMAAKDRFIIDKGEGWRYWTGLRRNYVTQHLNGKHPVGVIGHTRTHFIILDNDNHDQHQDIFLAKCRVLLDEFHGQDLCHFQLKENSTSGLHLIFIYNKSQPLEKLRCRFRERLLKLDQKYPELHQQIRLQQELDIKSKKSTKLKTLGEVEIYPDKENGIRLPLCPGRLMATDRLLSPVHHRKQMVADVESYVNWLWDEQRQYIEKEVVLDYLESHLQANQSLSNPTPQPDLSYYCSISESDASTSQLEANSNPRPKPKKISWKGNFHRFLCDWWIDGENHGIDLNTHIDVLVRSFMGRNYSDIDIELRVMEFIEELPPTAMSCSSRLRDADHKGIRDVVRRCVRQGFGGQEKPELSRWIFSELRHNCPWFDPGDKQTWKSVYSKSLKSDLQIGWDRIPGLIPYWMDVLKVKEQEVVGRLLDGIVNLVKDKIEQGNGFGRVFLQKWIRDKCPEIKVGYVAKVQRILKELQDRGIIQRVKLGFRPCGKTKGKCSTWKVGWQVEQLLSQSPTNPTPQPDLSYYCSISESSFETCSVEVLDSGEVLLHPTSDWSCHA